MEGKMRVDALVLEVTRRCNMHCEHCLRGEAQDMDMQKETVDTLLDSIGRIGSVTFTGGEPTLNLPLISYFFDEAEKRGVPIGSFFVATNGKTNQEALAMELLRRYPKMEEKELCELSLSFDPWHDWEYEDYENSILPGLVFYSGSKEMMETDGAPEKHVIPEGRAKDWGEGWKPLNPEIKRDDGQIEMLYVAANGKLIGECDFSFSHVDELSKYSVEELGELWNDLTAESDAA